MYLVMVRVFGWLVLLGRSQVDEGPDGDPQGCPGVGLPPLAYDLVVVAQRGGGFTVPRVQRGQGDFGEPGDQGRGIRSQRNSWLPRIEETIGGDGNDTATPARPHDRSSLVLSGAGAALTPTTLHSSGTAVVRVG